MKLYLDVDPGYTWRYVANDKIPDSKLEKIINKDLHPDSDIERGLRMQELIDKFQDPKNRKK